MPNATCAPLTAASVVDEHTPPKHLPPDGQSPSTVQLCGSHVLFVQTVPDGQSEVVLHGIGAQYPFTHVSPTGQPEASVQGMPVHRPSSHMLPAGQSLGSLQGMGAHTPDVHVLPVGQASGLVLQSIGAQMLSVQSAPTGQSDVVSHGFETHTGSNICHGAHWPGMHMPPTQEPPAQSVPGALGLCWQTCGGVAGHAPVLHSFERPLQRSGLALQSIGLEQYP